MLNGMLALSKTEVETIESQVGTMLDIVQTTWDSSRQPDSWWGPTWSGRSGSGNGSEQKRQDIQDTFGGTKRRLVLMYTVAERGNDHNYRPGANGEFDDAYRNMARDLVSMGMEDTILRISPEASMSWSYRYPLDVNGDPAPDEYADAFARCVSVMNEVPGTNFTFLYSPAGSRLGLTDRAFPTRSSLWPSGVEPPVMTPSFYDKVSSGGPTADEWKRMTDAEKERSAQQVWDQFHEPFLEMYKGVADKYGSRMGTVEWGTTSTGRPTVGRGDNPWYVDLSFDYFEANDFFIAGWWNALNSSGVDGHIIYPLDETRLPESAAAWKENVLRLQGQHPTVSDYTTPVRGSKDWNRPLNENFAKIEEDIQILAGRLDATVEANYAQPARGTTNWHIPLNENFAAIERDIKVLANNLANPPTVGAYNQPTKGTQNWDVPLNENFSSIERDLNAIVDRM